MISCTTKVQVHSAWSATSSSDTGDSILLFGQTAPLNRDSQGGNDPRGSGTAQVPPTNADLGNFKDAVQVTQGNKSLMPVPTAGAETFLRALSQTQDRRASDVAQQTVAQSMLSHVGKRIGAMSRAGSNTWASCFNIRVEVDSDEQMRLLSAKRFINGEPEDLNKHWLRRLLEGRAVAKALKCLALASMVYAPVQFALEPSCEKEAEHDAAAVLKVMNFVCSCIYLGVSAGQFQAIMTQPAIRAKGLLSIYFRLLVDICAWCGVAAEFVHLVQEPPSGLPTVAQGFILLNCLKAWRVFLPVRLHSVLLQRLALEVFHLFLWLVLASHLSACFFLAAAMFERKSGTPTWMDDLLDRPDEEPSCTDLYSAAVYFCAYTLTSIGYGDYVPANAFEHMSCAVFMLASQMFAAKIFADLAWITTTHHFYKAQHHARLTQTAAALASMGAHPSLRQRVLAYQDFIDQEQRERRARECMQDLSNPLREELKLVVYYDLVIRAPFLQEQPVYLVRAIIQSLQDVVYLPCDVIIRMGDLGTELYFLRNGRAAVYKTPCMPAWTDEPIFVLRNGNYFGEVALLTGQPRASWVISRTFCVCSILPKQVIDNMMESHPDCISGLVMSLKATLGLRPKVSWENVAELIREEFRSEELLYEFACNGDDGEAPAGLITWHRFVNIMVRCHVTDLDKKLLWVELDNECQGHVHYAELRKLIKRSIKRASKKNSEKAKDKQKAEMVQHKSEGSCEEAESEHSDTEDSDSGNDAAIGEEIAGFYTGPASAGTGEERQETDLQACPRRVSRERPRMRRRRSSQGNKIIQDAPWLAQGVTMEQMREMMSRLELVASQVNNLQTHLGCPTPDEKQEIGEAALVDMS